MSAKSTLATLTLDELYTLVAQLQASLTLERQTADNYRIALEKAQIATRNGENCERCTRWLDAYVERIKRDAKLRRTFGARINETFQDFVKRLYDDRESFALAYNRLRQSIKLWLDDNEGN